MVCQNRPYHFKFFKDCIPHILLGPYLNTLSHKWLMAYIWLVFSSTSRSSSYSSLQTCNSCICESMSHKNTLFLSALVGFYVYIYKPVSPWGPTSWRQEEILKICLSRLAENNLLKPFLYTLCTSYLPFFCQISWFRANIISNLALVLKGLVIQCSPCSQDPWLS